MITKLTLDNFRSHRSTEFKDLMRVNVFRGPNGAGKTSVQMALEYLFTGRCQVTDEGGRGADLLIMHGAKELRVSADHFFPQIGKQDAARIYRTRNRSTGTVTVQPPDFMSDDLIGRHAEAWIFDHVGSPDVLSAVLNSSRFIGMTPKEQKALLLSALPTQRVAVAEEIQKAMSAVGMPPVDHVSGAAAAEGIYDKFYEQRTLLNREIKAIGEITAPDIPADMPDADQVRTQLADLNQDRDTIITAIAQRKTEHKAAHDRLAEARRQLDAFKSDLLSDSDLEHFRKVGEPKNVKRAAELDQPIADNQALIRSLERQLADPGVCPTCQRVLERERSLADTKAALTNARDALADLQAKRLKLGDPALANQKLDAHKKAIVATGSAERAIREHSSIPDAVNLGNLEQDLSAIDQRIAKGSHVLAEVQRLEGARDQYQQALAKKQQLAQQVLAAEIVINAFAPGGAIRAQLVANRAEDFMSRLRAALEAMRFKCALSIEPYSFRVITADAALELMQLSESEAFRFGVAFQIALAEATGAPCVVIDRSDMLLPSLRPLLTGALARSSVEQIFILAAADSKPEQVPPGVRFFDLAKTGDGETFIAASYGGEIEEEVHNAAAER